MKQWMGWMVAALALAGCGRVQDAQQASASPAAASDAAIRKAVSGMLPPNVSIEHIGPAPIAGLREVVIAGRVYYATTDGKYFVQGAIQDIGAKVNLTEASEAKIHGAELAKIADDQRIVFPAAHEKYRVTVFTDTDCGYCRKFHSQIADYNARGITVQYLFFPRAGLQSDTYKTMVDVWCSDNRQQSLTDAKLGEALPPKSCTNPVARDFELGQRVGVTGTPSIFAPDGRQLGGYLPPDELVQALSQPAPKAAGNT